MKVLSKLILQREKNTTWRLFDNKNLSKGEVLSFLIQETEEELAKGKLIEVRETALGELTDKD